MKPENGTETPAGSAGTRVSGLFASFSRSEKRGQTPGGQPPATAGFQVSLPWTFLAAGAAALLIQLNPAWRDALLYDRTALAGGEWWRIWSGHFVHFGWPHFIADTGLLLILGWLLEARRPVFSRVALILMPAFISAVLYWLDPAMARYGGLSAVNLGLLLFLALQGWQRNWADWFWPAVLAIYVGEIIFEIVQGGRGGGLIRFDDPGIQVATSAHLASAAYALLAWLWCGWRATKKPEPAGSGLVS